MKKIYFIFIFFIIFPYHVIYAKEDKSFYNNHAKRIAVVIDVFRAFSTATYILSEKPASYFITYDSSVLQNMLKRKKDYFLIGKNEKNYSLNYDIPNSPSRVSEHNLLNKDILHRTSAGGKGIQLIENTDIILVAGFLNAQATVDYILNFQDPIVTLYPMGHEANIPSLEDDLCAHYIGVLLLGGKMNIEMYIPTLRISSGAYFFGIDQWQYPKEDFEICLELNKFHFAIEAKRKENYAQLVTQEVKKTKPTSWVKSVTIQGLDSQSLSSSNAKN